MTDLRVSAIIVLSAVAAGIVIHFIVAFFIKRWPHKAGPGEMRLRIDHLIAPLQFLTPLVCVLASLPLLHMNGRVEAIVYHTVFLLLIASIGWLAVRVTLVLRDAMLSRYDMGVRDNLMARRMYTQIRVIVRIIIVAVVIVTVSLMIMTFSQARQIGMSLLASAGIVGIVLGFAAQKTLGNVLAGIQIAIAQPIRIDDVVIVEGEWGWIEEITLTYVVVRIWDLRRLIVPIAYFIEKPFQNWTRVSADILGTVFLYVDYRIPLEEIRSELTRILNQSTRWDKHVNVLQVTDMKETTVEVRALMSAADSPTAWDLRCEVREKLLQFLQNNHPESFPQTRVLMENTK